MTKHFLFPKSAFHYVKYRDVPLYTGLSWKDGFFNESSAFHMKSKMRFFPYYHFKEGVPFAGKYINVDQNGMRKTVKGVVQSNAVKVFMFGGSTMFCSEVPDAYTIASQLQGLLGPEYDVYNFGQSAYVSVQELNVLLEQLSNGNVPNIVIYYDGVNDGDVGVYDPGVPRDPRSVRAEYDFQFNHETAYYFNKLLQRTSYGQFLNYLRAKNGAKVWDNYVSSSVAISRNIELTLQAYNHFIKQNKGIAEAYGYKTLFFWQPYLLSHTKKMVPFEQNMFNNVSHLQQQRIESLYREAKVEFSNREPSGVYFIGNIFDDYNEDIYTDFMHVGPTGNRIIAERMYKEITHAKNKTK